MLYGRAIFIGSFLSITGILTLIGIVLYVGSVSLAFDSISGPLRVETRYVYSFGVAFRLCVAAFVLSEFSGIFVIHLFLAERRHQMKRCNKAFSLGYNAMNSISADFLPSSLTPTATTSIAQISHTENCLDKAKFTDIPINPLHCMSSYPKTNHFPVPNHVANPLRVKVLPYNRLPSCKNQVSETSTRSMESLEPGENTVNSYRDSMRWSPIKNRKTIGPIKGSVNSVHSVGRLRRCNARSAVNICTEEGIPDFIPCYKSARGSKQLLYYSCRECEQQLLNPQKQKCQQNSPTLNHFNQTPSPASKSSISNDSMTPSLTPSCSSYSASEEINFTATKFPKNCHINLARDITEHYSAKVQYLDLPALTAKCNPLQALKE